MVCLDGRVRTDEEARPGEDRFLEYPSPPKEVTVGEPRRRKFYVWNRVAGSARGGPFGVHCVKPVLNRLASILRRGIEHGANLMVGVQNPAAPVLIGSDPGTNESCLSIKPSHERNLIASFLGIALVNANPIGPERVKDGSDIGRLDVSKRSGEALGHLQGEASRSR